MASLRIKVPGKNEMLHMLAGERITIGRRPDNTIQIDDRSVSAHHAELIVTNGHYRLHDLGSTNRTCVDDQPVIDYHLRGPCRVLFGTVECEFNPEPARDAEEKATEMVPTRGELDFLRRENADLQRTIAALQNQIDILSSARLMTKESAPAGVTPEAHRRALAQGEELRAQSDELKKKVENLEADLLAITRDRDATRQAWETVKAELRAVRQALSPSERAGESTRFEVSAGRGRPSQPQRGQPPSPVKPLMAPDAHRVMAPVLIKAPALVDAVRAALEKISAPSADGQAHAELRARSTELAAYMLPITGHPVQRLAASFYALVGAPAAFEPAVVRTLHQGVKLARLLLDARHLKHVKGLSHPRVLAIDDDNDLLDTLIATLGSADMLISSTTLPSAALALLHEKHFDLIFLDISLPEESGIDLCARIREITGCKKTPIVFLTGRDTVDDRAQSSLSGGNDFITKPFNTLELTLKAQIWIYRNQFALI